MLVDNCKVSFLHNCLVAERSVMDGALFTRKLVVEVSLLQPVLLSFTNKEYTPDIVAVASKIVVFFVVLVKLFGPNQK